MPSQSLGSAASSALGFGTEELGSGEAADKMDQVTEAVREAMADVFRPEFLNRVDENIIFRPLNRSDLREIAKLQLKRVEQRLADRRGPYSDRLDITLFHE